MTINRKMLFAISTLLVIASMLAGVALLGVPGVLAQGSGTVRVGTWESGDSLEPWNNAIAAFEEEYPDINVELEPVPQEYGTKLLAQLAAGTAPDIFQVGDGDVARYIREGVVAPLDPFIEGDESFSMDTFFPALAEFGQSDGTTYLFTKDYSPLVLYYNKDIFDEAGLEYPNPDWTWDDLLNAAQQLTTDDRWGIQLPGHWGDWLWHRGIQPILNQAGASLISEDGTMIEGYMNSPETVEALQWYVDLFLEHGVAPTREDIDSYAGVDLFANGIVAMVWTGRWPLKDWKAIDGFNFGTMELPAGPAGKGNALCWAGFAMNPDSDNQEAAWTFLKYIAAGEGAAQFSNYALSAVQPIIEAQGLSDDEYDGPIVDILDNVQPIPETFTPYFNECVLDPFRENLEAVFLQDVSVQEAMDAAAAAGQACLDEQE